MFEDTDKKKVSNFRRKFKSSLYVLQKHYGPSLHYFDKTKKEQIYSLSDI